MFNSQGFGPISTHYDVFETSDTDFGVTLGSMLQMTDGRTFVYCKNGGTALVPGKLIQSAVYTTVADFEDMAIATHAVGDTTLTITAGGTDAVTANQFAGGRVVVGAGAGELGHQYFIKSNTAAAAAATFTVTLDEAGGLRDTISAASTVNLYQSPWNGTVLDAATGILIGVPVCDVPASYYFWAQTRGLVGVVSGGAITIATPLLANGNGTVIVDDAATAKRAVGYSTWAFDSGDAGLIMLNLY